MVTESRPERRSGILQPTDVGSYSPVAIERLRAYVHGLYREHDSKWKGQIDPRYNSLYSILNHCVRVGQVASKMAKYLGLSEIEVTIVELAGLLHDISKIKEACENYREVRPWNDEERHAFDSLHQRLSQEEVFVLGRKMLRAEDRYFMDTVAIIVGNHHSWYRPSMPSIRFKCLIISLADSFVTLQEDRGYRRALGEFQAVEKLHQDITEMLTKEVYLAFVGELEACRRVLIELYTMQNIIPTP